MKKYYLLLFLLTISFFSVFGQLSNVHYLPPLKQGGNNQAIRQQAFYLSTPETTAFDVKVYQGNNAMEVATLTISNAAPGKYDVPDGDNNITLVTNTNTGRVLSNSGLRFESENGESFYVNYRGRSTSQATSLTSKGRQAIGTIFKWGGRPNYGNGQSSLNATLGIMATEPGTTTINIYGYGSDCEFRLRGDDDGITDDTWQIELTQGQTYVMEALRNATPANIDCWLGATIQSDKKIAISNGNLNGAPRIGSNNRDALIDQPVPENVLGREYVFIRGNGQDNIETPIIIGTQNGTDIFVGGVLETTINTGEYYVIDGSNYSPTAVSGNMYVTASKEVYAYQHLAGSGSAFTGGLNFIAPVNCLLPDRLSNISNIRDVDGANFNGGITIVASTTTPNANIVLTDDTGTVALANEQAVTGTGDWKTFYIPGLTGNVSVQSTGPIAVGFLGVSGAAGIAGYFSGFDTVPVVELDVTGGGCLPGADVFEISSSFDAYQWFQNGVLIAGATTNSFTPTEPGDFFVRVTKGTCTYDSAILSVYNCDPEIVLTKTVDTSPVIEGDTVTFTVTVEHLGVNPVSNLVINDALPSALIFGTVTPSFGTWADPDWTIGTMFSGEIHTLIIEATVNEGSAGLTVTNTISNTQTEVEANALPDDPTEDVTIINNELEITKSDQAPPDGSYDTVGEVITYDFVVTNTGNQVIPSVTITDPNIDVGSLSPASVSNLGIGAVANFTATHTITQADIEADQVVNTATAEGTLSNGFVISDTSDDPDDPTTTTDDPTITPIDQKGAIVLEKIAQPAPDGLYDTLGEIITYEFTVINTGNVSLNNITITDSNIDSGSLSPTSVTNLPAGESVVFTATHEIVQPDFDNGNTTNIATATGTEPVEGLVVSDMSDDPTTLAPNDATVVTIPQFGRLEVTKVDDAPTNGPYNMLGQTITYTIIATSVGNVTLTDINVVDPNADTITLISTTGTDTGTDNIVDSMVPMDTATFEATHVITQDDLDAAQVVNTATVGAQDPGLGSVTDLSDDPDDPTTTTNDPTIVPLISTPSITVAKLADDDSNVTEGQTITYTYTVSNTGNVTFDEVSLADVHSGSGTLGIITLQSTTGTDDGADNDVDQLDPGTNAIWTVTYVVTATDIINQADITNTVTATATPRTGSIADPADFMATETVTVNPIETICGGTTLAHDLTADVNPTIVSFSWSASNNPFVSGETISVSTDSEITDTLINTSITDQEVIYTITGFDSGGIPQDTYTYIVTIQRTPRVNNTTRTVDICTGDTLNQNLITQVSNYDDGVTFSWSAVDNPNISGETTATSTNDRIEDTLINTSTVAQDVVYTITPTADANGCVGTIYTITVTVEPPLVIPPNDSATVECIADATQPTAPTVTDSNGTVITPVITENTDPTCEGDKIYTYTYTDCAGNISVYTFTYTIEVTTLPVVPANGTATVECIADATQPTAPTVTDVCGNNIVPVITENTDPTCEGDKIYTYTYTDCAGNVSVYTFTYTIDLTTSPVVPANGTATVECIADATQPAAPVVTDVCGNNITPVITENTDPACEGDKIYTYTYTDCAGNVSVYTFTYTIDVTTPPVVPANGTATVECIADATQPAAPVVTDVCGNDITPVITENTDPTCEGDKIYTYTYTDCAGNISVYTFTYTIDVTTSPVVPANGTATVECIADATQPAAPVVTDVCGNNIVPVITENTDPTCEGDKIYTYTYTDCAGNVSVYTFTYTIEVTTLPVVPVNGTATVECIADATQPTAPTVTDVCGNNITPVITKNTDPTCEGDKIYTYTYTDCAGNVSIYTFTYTIDVTTLPVVPVDGTATVECIADATQPTAPTVTDVCGNNIVPVITENTDPTCEGDKIYTYTFTDCAGNVSVYTFTYTLDVTTLPVVPANGTATVECIADATQPAAPVVTDVCGNNIVPVITENTDPTCEGDKIYTYTYTDCAGNVSVYTFTYTLDVTTLPVVPANGTATVECIADATQPAAPIVTDVCGNNIVPVITENTDPTCEGDKIYTYTYTDCAGNVSVYTFTYTIDVTTLPVVPVDGTATVECIADATQPAAPVVTDVCGNNIVPVITENTDPTCEGDKIYTYTYTDCAGNISVYTFTYTIDVTTLPVVPADGTATVECIADATQPTAPTVTDVCNNDITPVITENTDPSCEGDKIYTYTYTDCAGNVSVYTFTYTIEVTTLPVVPADGTAIVECIADATQPTAPVVTDVCGNNIAPVITENTDPTCEGDKIYTYTYTDCAGNVSVYTFTYTLDVTTLPVVPVDGTAIVECIADATQPAAPIVTDVCGNNIVPAITENTDPTCEGDKIYTYIYTDCAGNISVYTFTYTIEVTTLPVVPADGTATVECIADATQPAAPVVTDVCGNNIVAVITENTDPTCEGDKIYTYTYTDCAGNVSVYTFTYTIDVTTLPVVPSNGTATVECIADATQPAAPVVTDVCGNNIVAVITENTDPTCEGDKIYTYTYTDCAGNVSVYTFTYTLDVTTLPVVPVDGTTIVECIADATQPAAPIVTDVCGNNIVPVITENTDPTCEGDKIYTYTYTDCAGNVSVYTFTYTIEVTTLPIVPADGTATVNDIVDAIQPTAPIVTDVCGNNIVPIITESTDPTCDGIKTYTFTYTDCAGNSSVYNFTYTIDVTATLEISDTSTSICSNNSLGFNLSNLTTLSGVTFDWIVTPNPNVNGAVDGNGTIIPDTIQNISGSNEDIIYTITPFNSNGCIGNTFTVTVTVLPEPFNNIAPTDSTCSSISLNHDLSADVDIPGTTFSWFAADNVNVTGETTTPDTSILITDTLVNTSGNIQTVVYTITPTSPDGCLGNPYTYTVTVSPEAEIVLTKSFLPATDGNYDTVGEVIRYEIIVQNINDVEISNVNITDSNADPGSISPATIATIPAMNSVTVTATHTITQNDLDSGQVINSATAMGVDPCGTAVSDISDDPTTATPDDNTITPLDQNPSIQLTKAADTAPDGLWDTVGEIITYTLEVTNSGNVTLSNINISDSNADPGSISPASITTLLPRETITVIAAHTITQQDLDTASVTNIASVTAEDTNGGMVIDDSDDPNNPTDNDNNGDGEPDDPTITFTPQLATISILKTVDTTTYTEIDDILNYTITVTNTGNVTLLNVNITDPNAVFTSPSTIASLAPGETFSITAGHIIVEDDIINGFVANTAFVNASLPNSTMTITEDSDDPNDPNDVDSDNDGDPDDPTISYLDTDGDGIPNITDLDDDNDGITDIEEQNGDPLLDTDGDGIIDSLDLDADGDGIYDYIEAGHDGIDSDGDGTIDGPYGDDGIPDQVQDDPDTGEVNYDPQDTDGDGIDDFQDIDDDNDGILTEDENPDPDGDMVPDDAFDSDGDGIPDYLEPNNSDATAEDDLEIFNAVTPNGDGNNDVFIIRNIENFPDNELKIFNRWGVLVYEAIGYGQNQEYFRGESNGRVTVNQERQLPVGTYFYVLAYKNNEGESKTRSGYLYINR
ncbi:PKD-like domain-containing protein [uncultured Aquimarina sp.]|uniref:HYR-like domain-containing protein n=1 Tax=uncultured Aquimarina sp. TaxID=575652 RepID=UPI002611D96A|nr:PKD-like domain-containing protein [uncultured Aquimarina sp.]